MEMELVKNRYRNDGDILIRKWPGWCGLSSNPPPPPSPNSISLQSFLFHSTSDSKYSLFKFEVIMKLSATIFFPYLKNKNCNSCIESIQSSMLLFDNICRPQWRAVGFDGPSSQNLPAQIQRFVM